MEDFNDLSGLEEILADPKTLEDLGRVKPPVEFRDQGGQLLATGRIVGEGLEHTTGIFWPDEPNELHQAAIHEGTMRMGTEEVRARMSFYPKKGVGWMYQVIPAA
jgi:hypothetical protein